MGSRSGERVKSDAEALVRDYGYSIQVSNGDVRHIVDEEIRA